jgi:cystathionine beta-lyase/cystathionine gamma-synthase
MKVFKRIETNLIHAGESKENKNGAVVTPIYQSAMFEYAGEQGYDNIRYIRLNNTPNQIVLHKKLAALENAEDALVTTSGMAAISTTLFTLLSCGDHILAQDCLYGGTYDLITKEFESFGISYDLVDGNDPDSWRKRLRPNTKAIYVESITNPLVQVADLKSVVKFATENGLISIIDNTFTSPINFRPVELGFDLSLHSCTKYMNGHSDIVAGACIGRADLIEKIKHKLGHFGGSLDPHAAYLLNRGIKTLALRVRHQNESALKIAQYLEARPEISKVNYPGLESHAQHSRARELFEGFGGMLSFEMKGGLKAAERLIERLNIPLFAPSLGSVETLIILPAISSHAGLTREERLSLGITDSLIRLSVGIEATDELIEDFDQALK